MTGYPPPFPTTPPNETRTDDLARALVERQLEMLGRLAEAGLNIALAIERQVTAAAGEAAPEVVQGDVSLAYARVARAVRLTIVLQSKLIEDLRALDRGAVLASHERRRQVGRIVERVIEADRDCGDAADRLIEEAGERLEYDDIYGDVLARPASELIAQICCDLGVAPDWDSLATEAWAQAEIRGGAAGSPLAAWTAGTEGGRIARPALRRFSTPPRPP